MSRRVALAEALDSLEEDATHVVLRALDPVLDRIGNAALAEQPPAVTASTLGLAAAAVDTLAGILTDWGVAVDRDVLPYFEGVYKAGGLSAVARLVELGIEPSPDATVDPFVDEAASRHLAVARDRFLQIGDVAWRHARLTLLEGYEQGLGVDQIARNLRGVTDLSTAVARLIARTEVVSAANAGAMKRAELEGEDAPRYKGWLSTLDSRTRPSHVTADGQVVDRNATFVVGGRNLQYPGDPAGGPEETYNCRCTIIFCDDPDQCAEDVGAEGRQEGGVLEDTEDALVAAADLPRGPGDVVESGGAGWPPPSD